MMTATRSNHRFSRRWAPAGGLLLAAVVAAAAADKPADLRVTHVAVFSSGVAYYQCEATVDGNATAELTFRTEQINDIIKSLVVEDLDGGTVGTVGYASHDPIEKTLRSFGVDITGKPTLGQLLDQLRGEPVRITGAQSLAGLIVGVETRQVQVGDQGLVHMDFLNVLTDAGLRQISFSGIEDIQLANARISAELRKALETLATGHDADKKTVVLHFDGQGRRRVRVSYLLEAPIWKTSYRLVIDDEGHPAIQGWATVDNATEEDWRDVRLALVSGRPISFAMDLYTPIYVPRPREELELYASLRPPEYAGAFEEDKAKRGPAAGRVMRSRAPAGRGGRLDAKARKQRETLGYAAGAMPAAVPAEKRSALSLQDAGVRSVAGAAEAGELFQYVIRTPVSIPRQHSAMLPIVNEKITGEKVSIFNPATHPKYPLNGLEITNTTGLNLMQGPITVFDGNTYAGDAKLPNLKPQEKRLIAYALDLGTEVMVKQQPRPDRIVSLKIVRGMLIHTHRYLDERTYVVKNKNDKPRTVLIEQPYGDEWKLIEPARPYQRAPGLSRFKVSVGAHETKSLTVRLEQVTDQSIAVANLAPDRIRFYLRARVIPDSVRQALQRVIALQDELHAAQRRRQMLERDLNEQVKEQARIRDNLKTLPKDSDPYRRQLRKFDEIESRIEKLRTELQAARAAEQDRQRALDGFVRRLNVE